MHLFCVDCILQNGWVRLDRTLLCFAGGRVHAIFLFNLLCLVYFVLLFLRQLPAYISIEFGACIGAWWGQSASLSRSLIEVACSGIDVAGARLGHPRTQPFLFFLLLYRGVSSWFSATPTGPLWDWSVLFGCSPLPAPSSLPFTPQQAPPSPLAAPGLGTLPQLGSESLSGDLSLSLSSPPSSSEVGSANPTGQVHRDAGFVGR